MSDLGGRLLEQIVRFKQLSAASHKPVQAVVREPPPRYDQIDDADLVMQQHPLPLPVNFWAIICNNFEAHHLQGQHCHRILGDRLDSQPLKQDSRVSIAVARCRLGFTSLSRSRSWWGSMEAARLSWLELFVRHKMTNRQMTRSHTMLVTAARSWSCPRSPVNS